MKSLLGILALAGTIALAAPAALQVVGGNPAIAQTRDSSACFQNCRNVRDWASAAQCREFCKGRPKKKTQQ